MDGRVRLHKTSYDTQGQVYQMTAYPLATGGAVLNQVQDAYNGLGQLTGEYQSHSGAVNTTTTPKVQYAYSDPTTGSRLSSMTYPNGRILHYGYDATALDNAIGRISYLADDNGSGGVGPHLADYQYLGTSTVVNQADGNGVSLSYLQQPGDTHANADGGDAVTGLDRFGRVSDQNYVKTSTGTSTDRFQYGYDRNSNVLYKNNLVNGSWSELYHANSTSSGDNNSGYDPLNRLTGFSRGTLTSSSHNPSTGSGQAGLDTISTAAHSQGWSLDALGNQASVTTDGTATARTHNSRNQVTAVGASGLVFDNNGNTTTDEQGRRLAYDAWNHLVSVKTSGGATLATYTLDAAGRRITQAPASGIVTDLYYGGNGNVLEERQISIVARQNVWGIGYVNDLILRDDNFTAGGLGLSGSGLGRRLYAQHDANYNVTALTDASGNVLERFAHDPYGSAMVLTPTWSVGTDLTGWAYLFQDMRFDPATGLYTTPNRDYSPTLGRWMQMDPTGYPDGPNAYWFLNDATASSVDPLGFAESPSTKPASYDSVFKPYPDDRTHSFALMATVDDLLLGKADKAPPEVNLPQEIDLALGKAVEHVKASKAAGNPHEWGGLVAVENYQAHENKDYKPAYVVWGPTGGGDGDVQIRLSAPLSKDRKEIGMYHVHVNSQLFSTRDVNLFLNANSEETEADGFSLLSDCTGSPSWLLVSLKDTVAGKQAEDHHGYFPTQLRHVSADMTVDDAYRKTDLPVDESRLATSAAKLNFAFYKRSGITGPFKLVNAPSK